jgi:hypothetical protein
MEEKTNSMLHQGNKCKNANAMRIGIRICINANGQNFSHRTLIRIRIALPALMA